MAEVKKKNPKPKYTQKVAFDMSNLYLDPHSVLHCSKCKDRLGVLHIIRYSIFKKKGTPYNVPCKSCGHLNKRIKGEYKQDVDEFWKDFSAKSK